MKKTIEFRTKLGFLGIMRLVTALMLVVSTSLIILFGVDLLITLSNNNNTLEVTGIVESVYTDEDFYCITLEKNTDIYYVGIKLVANKNYTVPSVGDTVTIKFSPDEELEYEKQILTVLRNDEKIISYGDFLVNTAKLFFTIFAVIFIVSLILKIVFKILFNKAKKQEVDILDFRIKSLINQAYVFRDPKYKLSYCFKDAKRASRIFFVFMIIIIVFLIICFTKIELENDVVFLVCMIGSLGLLSLAIYYLFRHTYDHKHFKKERVKDFIDDFNLMLKEGEYEPRTRSLEELFTDEGVNYDVMLNEPKEEPFIIPLEDLNLYTKVYYNHSINMSQVYVCTELDPVKYESVYEDILFFFDASFIKMIDKYHLEVRGLNFVLENLEEETLKHLKNVEIINYK